MSVVDDRLRVRGIEGLRVIDASVMPGTSSSTLAHDDDRRKGRRDASGRRKALGVCTQYTEITGFLCRKLAPPAPRRYLPASNPGASSHMATTYLDFEKPFADLEKKIAELEAAGGATVEEEVGKLREKAEKQLEHIYTHLNAWQKTQVARHPERPHFLDYVEHLFEEFVELAGDRKFMNDDAILGGLARFRGKPVVVIGHERAATRRPASSTISGWASRKAIARRCASSNSPAVSTCRSSRWSTPRAPSRARAVKNVGRPKRSPAPSRPASRSIRR